MLQKVRVSSERKSSSHLWLMFEIGGIPITGSRFFLALRFRWQSQFIFSYLWFYQGIHFLTLVLRTIEDFFNHNYKDVVIVKNA